MLPDPPAAAGVSRRGLRWTGALLALIAIAVVAAGLLARRAQSRELRQRADAQAVPTVVVRAPQAAASAAPLELPGRLEAWARAPIYARVGGYLKRWTADIGASVQAGQLLAEIETPEIDQQLLQARADLATAQANAALAASTAERWKSLLDTGAVSRQGVEEKLGDLAAKQSIVKAMQANVERMQTLKQFARVTAPFAGTVTARNTDVGALIGAGSGEELFVVSDTRRLRVYVGVPQSYAAQLARGAKAGVSVPERPGRSWQATVESSAGAIDAAAGSMQVQLAVDNAQGELLPGSYASVSFDLPRGAGTLAVPPGALIFGKSGLRVATVGAGDKVVLKPVTVARDLGTMVELASGLQPADRVIESPPDGLEDGDVVRVAPAR